MIRKLLFIHILVLSTLLSSQAQSVGLVLSGGGAKGLAHIGIIRVLEENNIPIDYIAGTSIGAIVGGLYASGYTVDEMEALFKSEDFYFWSTGKIQEEYRYYFKQAEPDPSWLKLRVAKKEDKVKLLPPTNVIPEEQMDFAFLELMASQSAACDYNFDDLMVPYFCVATDVNNGKAVILREGNLDEAIRASMTVPLYFKPIEINGRLLFDGGIVNNFPHDLLKEIYKPDVIIGHKVTDDKVDADADDVMQQISNLVLGKTDFNIAPEDGIFMETKFDNVNLLDFSKYEEIVAAGKETALHMVDSIKKRIPRQQTQEMINQKREAFNDKKPELFFQNIQVEGIADPMQRKYIIQSIKHNYNVITLSSFKKEYFKLIADEHIKSIRPISRYNSESGYFDLHLIVEPEKKVEVKIGGNISTKPINQGFASFDYRAYQSRAYTLSSNIYFGRFYSSFKAGARIDYPTKLPFYLATYATFNRWDFFSSSSELFFEDVRPPFIIQDENNVRFEAGFPIGVHRKFLISANYANSVDEYYQTEKFNKEDVPDKTRFKAFVSQLGLENNSLNYKQLATDGSYHLLSAKYIIGDELQFPGSIGEGRINSENHHKYLLLKASSSRYFTFGKRFTLGTMGEAVFSNKKLFQNYRSTLLSAPGFYPTPHSRSLFIGNFHSNNYIAGGLKFLFHFNPTLHFRLEGYGFVPVKEVLQSADNKPYKSEKYFENYYLQGMASLVYQTGAGPLSFNANYYEKENTEMYLTLSFGYILFNKKGL